MLEEANGSLCTIAAGKVGALASSVLGLRRERTLKKADAIVRRGLVRASWREDADYHDVVEYVAAVSDFFYALDGLSTISERLALQARVDFDAMYQKLEVFVDAALDTIGSVKRVVTSALVGLERLYAAALENSAPEADLPGALQLCVSLPSDLDRVIKRSICNRLALVIAPVEQEGLSPTEATGATFVQLRKLHDELKKKQPERMMNPKRLLTRRDTTLDASIAKVERWMEFGGVDSIHAARTIAVKWRYQRRRRRMGWLTCVLSVILLLLLE